MLGCMHAAILWKLCQCHGCELWEGSSMVLHKASDVHAIYEINKEMILSYCEHEIGTG
jgi:hypothetical protein